MQGNNWVKKMEKEKEIKSIKPIMELKLINRTLKSGIENGIPIILEDAGEAFDPVIEPLLGKQIQKNGNTWMIKLGEDNVVYSQDFRFYITTKLARPHYAPEVCVKVTMLNFQVTEEGLKDQMLNIVVKHEDPKSMKNKQEATIK